MSACIVAIAMLAVHWCKLSLHAAFAVYAAGLLWPWGVVWMGVACVFAGIVAWSRLQLSRHRPRDIVAGAAAGGLAASGYWVTLRALQAAP